MYLSDIERADGLTVEMFVQARGVVSTPEMGTRPRLVYCTTVMASFARKDVQLLSTLFDVEVHLFAPRKKWMTPFSLLKQFFFLARRLNGAAVSVTQFGGYHSLFPALLGLLFRVPSVIVLGGFDCASFPSFNYGAHRRPPLSWFTRRSLRWATHLVPCSASLMHSQQHYLNGSTDPAEQGCLAFDPRLRTPFTIIPYGYDANKFSARGQRFPNSFLTVAQMNQPNFRRKGVDLFFLLARHWPEHRFTLVGNTPRMRYRDVPSNVELIGYVPYEELPALYSRHTFYLQLSIWEGFPSAPCEAMLCGCVPIVSSVATLPEIVGDSGFVLEHLHEEECIRLVEKALASDLTLLSVLARDRILKHFPESTRKAFLDLVVRIAKRGCNHADHPDDP